MEIVEGKRVELEPVIAELIKSKVNDLLDKQDEVVIGIPGGRSVGGIFKRLLNQDLYWARVHIFMVDERLVDFTSDDSNFRLAKEMFIDELVESGDLPKENMHVFSKDMDVDDYRDELRTYGGRFDIVILSSGEDGHVGSLFPRKGIDNYAEFFFKIDDSPKPPKERMTASKRLLENSQVGILLFFGESKKAAFEQFQDAQVSVEDCPAKLVEDIKESYIFVSED